MLFWLQRESTLEVRVRLQIATESSTDLRTRIKANEDGYTLFAETLMQSLAASSR